MVRVLNVLCSPPDIGSLPIVQDLYLDLYEVGFPRPVLDVWKAQYGNDFGEVLPHLYDGQFFALSRAVNSTRLIPSRRNSSPSQSDADRGRELLLSLAEYLIRRFDILPDHLDELKSGRDFLLRTLELDGYSLVGNKLVPTDSAVVKLSEETTLLKALLKEACFANGEVILHHYEGAEDLFSGGKWGPCIGAWRNFYQQILQDIARVTAERRPDLSKPPGPMKDLFPYLVSAGFLSADEQTAVGAVWGFLCSGSHPGITEEHSAKFAMMLGLSFGQVLVLKFLDWWKNGFASFSASC